jgi:glycosyltransferase involved in cell wall biosynthesis
MLPRPLPVPAIAVRAGRRLIRPALWAAKAALLLLRSQMRKRKSPNAWLPYESLILDQARYYEPDVVHVHDLPRLALGVRIKELTGAPLVYDAHELYPEIATLTAAQKWALTRLEARLSPRCDRVITVNPFIAREMADRYGIEEPAVLCNAIDPPADLHRNGRPDRLRQDLELPPSTRILLYQGWMSRTRGLQELVRAMAEVDKRIHLVMMGYGEAREELVGIADELSLRGRVHFKDAVPVEELLWWTASADAGIIPYQPVDLNNYYCSPNKLFEFIQAHLPPIVNDLPFLRSVVGEEGFGVVAPLEKAESYAAAIGRAFDPESGGTERFRERIRERAEAYSWSSEKTKLLDVYARIGS